MDRTRHTPTTRTLKRLIAWSLLALLIVTGGVTLARIDFSTQRVARDRLTIDTVQRGTLEIKVNADGQLLPKNIEQIAAQVTGRVTKVYVKPGAVVRTGQILAELANPQLVASAEEAYSAWEGARTELRASQAELQTNVLNQEVVLTQAQFNLERAKLQLDAETKLISQHIVSEIDYKRSRLTVEQLMHTREIEATRLRTIRDNVEVRLDVSRSRVTQLARALDRARNEVANLRIVAGIDGTVQAIGIDVGQELQPGGPVGRIAQPDPLYAELKVPAREATEVQPGQAVLVDTHAGTVDGMVTRVDPAVTEGTVIVDADLKGPTPRAARPHLPIDCVIYLSRMRDALYVGKPAYVRSDAAIAVYRLDRDGRYADRVIVKAGRLSLNYVQVLDGLQAGDRIITSDSGEWQDKDRILIN
ncbi:MAG TPA: efflux RND transporter periplasmic adaptor subunit [Steroidobacteraceae bacterium]|nr:efflux RND transporter periplasmic adaptor subunit [Steroidobacteraceae bacterium]